MLLKKSSSKSRMHQPNDKEAALRLCEGHYHVCWTEAEPWWNECSNYCWDVQCQHQSEIHPTLRLSRKNWQSTWWLWPKASKSLSRHFQAPALCIWILLATESIESRTRQEQDESFAKHNATSPKAPTNSRLWDCQDATPACEDRYQVLSYPYYYGG